MSEPNKKPSWDEVFEALDKAGPFPDDFLSPEDRDQLLPQVRESWEPEYDDEPRSGGKSGLGLFAESCAAADAERARREKEQPEPEQPE